MSARPDSPPAYRGRFAPSPTGPLHFGSLLAAFGSWLLARHAGGEWWVRVEDLDPPREIAGAADQQLATLAAFGLVSDGPVVRQSERGERYQAALGDLLASGQAFFCHCSRTELAATGGVHHQCVGGGKRPHPAVRLRVAPGTVIGFEDGLQGWFEQDVHAEAGDVVLRRADGYWAYQLAVVVDDAAQDFTDIVRGADLLDSTPRQIHLQHALGLPTPRYLHLPLIVDADGHKLSKSMAALPIDAADPLPPLRAAWTALGQPGSRLPAAGGVPALLRAAAAAFAPERLPRQARLAFAAPHNTPAADAV
nr:tRNA glutamyl-Q(34) synthetase GluQRS [Pseudoxanthomonas sp.]